MNDLLAERRLDFNGLVEPSELSAHCVVLALHKLNVGVAKRDCLQIVPTLFGSAHWSLLNFLRVQGRSVVSDDRLRTADLLELGL